MTGVVIVVGDAGKRGDIVSFLEKAGYATRGVADGMSTDSALREEHADIVVLDLDLPGEDGYSIVSRLRLRPALGVIVLSGRANAVDQIVGLASGADIFLPKPVDLRVLEASIRNLARRLRPGNAAQRRPERPAVTAVRHWHFDPTSWLLTAPNGISTMLSASEQRVLRLLAASTKVDGAVNREDIHSALGFAGLEGADHRLNTLMTRLRRKVKSTAGMTLPIKSVRDVGYAFAGILCVVEEPEPRKAATFQYSDENHVPAK